MKIFISILFFLVSFNTFASDTVALGDDVSVILLNKDEYIGKVSGQNETTLTVDLEQGGRVSVEKKEIKTLAKITNNPQYLTIGFSGGNPGGFNAEISYTLSDFRVGFAGGGLDYTSGTSKTTIVGVEGNVGYLLTKLKNVQQGLMLSVGTFTNSTAPATITINGYSAPISNDPKKNNSWRYIGGAYFLDVYGFLVQVGLSYGLGDFSSPQVLFRAGYLINLN